MSDKPVHRCTFSPAFKDKLTSPPFNSLYPTLRSLLPLTPLELQEHLDLSYHDALLLQRQLSQNMTLDHMIAWNMLTDERYCKQKQLSLAQDIEDLKLQTGLTELVGPGGVGKSQFCLTLIVLSLLPVEYGGHEGSVVYIDTEGTFAVERLAEIAQTRYPNLFGIHSEHHNNISYPKAFLKLIDRIKVIRVSTSQQLLDTLLDLDRSDTFVAESVHLLIVDGIASPLRADFSSVTLSQRQERMSSIASLLKFLSQQCHCPVVVTNQVVSSRSAQSSEQSITAALGVSWAHAVNTRLLLEQHVPDVFRIKLAKSSVFQCNKQYRYTINAMGVEFDPQPIVDACAEETMNVLEQHLHTVQAIDQHHSSMLQT